MEFNNYLFSNSEIVKAIAYDFSWFTDTRKLYNKFLINFTISFEFLWSVKIFKKIIFSFIDLIMDYLIANFTANDWYEFFCFKQYSISESWKKIHMVFLENDLF